VLHIPLLNYTTAFGVMPLWVDFKYSPSTDGKALFEVTDFGQVK
jgi:hypothetical protein